MLENDLERRLPQERLEPLLARSRLVVLDHQMTDTARRAEVVLPAASFAEATARWSTWKAARNATSRTSIRRTTTARSQHWNHGVGSAASRGGDDESENLDDVLDELEAELPQFKGVAEAAPGAKFRMHGMGLARAPHRQSGRTAARAIVFVHEPRSTRDVDTALNFSMEGYNGTGPDDRPPELLPFAWAPGWNSPQAWNKFQTEVGGALRGGDPGVHLFEAKNASDAPVLLADDRTEGSGLRALIPLHEHFGSEELSSLADPIQARTAQSYVVFNALDAQQLGFDDQSLRAHHDRQRHGEPRRQNARRLPEQLDRRAGWPAGHAAVRTDDALQRREGRLTGVRLDHTRTRRDLLGHVQGPRDSRRRDRRRRADDLGRTAAARAVAGPLRPEPGRLVRPAPGCRPTW